MKGIFNLKNYTKYLPNKSSSKNVLGKNINGSNSSFFHSENKSKLKIDLETNKKSFLKVFEMKKFFGLTNISDKVKFSLSNIIINYYNKIQMTKVKNQMNDLAILKLSGDKNNLNGENKNINEDDLNIKINSNSKENKKSNGNRNFNFIYI